MRGVFCCLPVVAAPNFQNVLRSCFYSSGGGMPKIGTKKTRHDTGTAARPFLIGFGSPVSWRVFSRVTIKIIIPKSPCGKQSPQGFFYFLIRHIVRLALDLSFKPL